MITPQAGYTINPTNPNGVVKLTDINPATGYAYGVPTATPQGTINTPTIPTTINSQNMSSNGAITIPPPPTPTDLTSIINNGNAKIAGGNAQVQANVDAAAKLGITIPGSTETTPSTVTTPTSTSIIPGYDYIKNLIGNYGTAPSEAEQYAKTYGITPEEARAKLDQAASDTNAKNATLNSAKAKLAGFNAQLASMNLQTTANNTALETQGGAITSRGVGIAQTANSRENLIAQAPIQFQALMAQAEVATAQGDVQLAQSIQQQAQGHLDDLFKAQTIDATNAYNQRKDLIDKAYTFADKQETKQLDAQKQTLATNNTQYNNFVNDVRTAASSATSALRGDVATKLSALVTTLNPTSKTFAQDYQKAQSTFATLQGQIVPKATTEQINQSTISNVNSQLTKAVGSDGYTDPNLYARLRSSSTLSGSDFDNRFGYLVNPESRSKLGLGSNVSNTTFGTPGEADRSAVFSALATQSKAVQDSIDQNKLKSDPTYFYWVKSQLKI